jgi:hypothetical protein
VVQDHSTSTRLLVLIVSVPDNIISVTRSTDERQVLGML